MAIARITGQGLATIAALVVLLWISIFAERALVRRAQMETRESLRQIRSLEWKRQASPVAAPRTRPARPAPGIAG
ncbi:MAG: hypothetical protein FJW37_06675 [Acidobacteria bacterium]|nr:hypothetical protein [Acidobacteriota bacterium]